MDVLRDSQCTGLPGLGLCHSQCSVWLPVYIIERGGKKAEGPGPKVHILPAAPAYRVWKKQFLCVYICFSCLYYLVIYCMHKTSFGSFPMPSEKPRAEE